ncbi:MAG: sugar transferase PEP-CTERM/EpsH1 system associated [bacterium]|nr:MAG: sugar transferase PEP-CTERM/EpsH1 system associated [bacterium]KAF0149854.1 MAG: sugar transferase PEP-CTERM/EpsH1 system associated [bacterium]KAF0168555.1 MAG: sugar transferase PEP-CTERM/EpsH1 system associated [bacterium]
MSELLFLAHRIPYPPNKGDKIRAWHLLEHLARRHRVHLGAFVDDPDDWRHADKLREVCASVHLTGVDPRRGKLRALTGLFTGEPLTLPFYRDADMQRWVDARLTDGVDRVLAYSSAMARFVMGRPGLRRIMDFVDIDSDKWRQYAPTKTWPLSWLYRREGERLLAWERRVAAEFDASLFVSAAEAADFRLLAPESAGKVGYFHNGVDADYFSPERAYANPYPAGSRAVVFTGAMDYWPNVDAVLWFAAEVFPALRAARPELLFVIVGGKPAAEVRALAAQEGVRVTGRVEDVRPWVAHAAAVVAPLRIARGIQNKVLEGMAMARTVVATPQALEGIDAAPDQEILLAADKAAMVAAVLRAIDHASLGDAARAKVLRDFDWAANLARVDELLER